MTKTIHFLSGLPRSGMTLLSNVLAQNPRLHATSGGGVLAAMLLVRNEWSKMVSFRATPNDAGKLRSLRGMLEGYYADVLQPVIIDRSLGWLGALEMAETILERPAKVLVCVRDVRDVLATFELQWRTDPAMRAFIEQHPSLPRWETVAGRCDVWASNDESVGIAYNQIKDALSRGYRDRLHFVEFEQLMATPHEVLAGIYQFLGEPAFPHNVTSIRQVVWETYSLYGVPEHKDIPTCLTPIAPLWPEVLGGEAQRYDGLRLW